VYFVPYRDKKVVELSIVDFRAYDSSINDTVEPRFLK
jgi:hypothetical protein